jgi:hypothetical protein
MPAAAVVDILMALAVVPREAPAAAETAEKMEPG